MDYISGIKAKKTHIGRPEQPKNVALKKFAQRHILSDSILLVEMALTGRLAIVVSLPQLMKWGNVAAHEVHVGLNMLLLLLFFC